MALVQSKPILKTEPVRRFLEEMLRSCDLNGNSTFDDLKALSGCEALVIAADMRDNKARIFRNDDNILEALVASCAMPFVFRAPKCPEDVKLLDGGIFDNLPTKYLSDDAAQYGPVIGVSFEPETWTPPGNTLAYAARLVGAIIDEKVNLSSKMIGEANIHRIETDVTTFDFDEFVTYGLSIDHFGRIEANAKLWLRNWLNDRKRPASGQKIIVNDNFDYYSFTREALEGVYKATQPKRDFVSGKVEMKVIAHSLREDTEAGWKDEVWLKARIEAFEEEEIRAYKLFVLMKDGSSLESVEWFVVDSTGNSVGFHAVPAPVEKEGLRVAECYIFFDAPLKAKKDGGEYLEVTQKQRIGHFMSELAEHKEDSLGIYLDADDTDTIDEVEIQLCIPRELGKLVQEPGKSTRGKHRIIDLEPVPMRPSEFPEGFKGYSMRGGKIGKNEAAVVKYTLARSI